MLLTLAQIRDELQVSRETVYKLIAEGMPVSDLGTENKHSYRFDSDAVKRWLITRRPVRSISTGRMKRR